MNPEVIEQYVDKVYAYAIRRTFTEEEAADLSQEILYTVLRELHKLRDDRKLEPWLWSIADNITKSFSRKQGKQRAMFTYDIPEDLMQEEKPDEEEKELYASLRKKIAGLSQMYRDIIILHYYDGLSTKQISERLSIPEGTVTWRLSEARKKLKKECNHMEESALRPKQLYIGIYGSGNYNGETIPFPSVYISDALSQNILYYCYEEAHTIEELSKLCGVPAYYIEERIEHLLKHDAILETAKGKYRTDFIIYSDKHGIYCEEHAEKTLMPIMDKLLSALDNVSEEASQLNFYKAGKSKEDLYYLYGVLAFSYLCNHYSTLPSPSIPERYDGNHWRYVSFMENGQHRRTSINMQKNGNREKADGYSYTIFSVFGELPRAELLSDTHINACEDILTTGTSADTSAVAEAIQKGKIIRKDNGEFFITVPAFDTASKEAFYEIVEKHFAPLMEEYSSLTEKFVAGYKKLFPKHLNDDIDRMCHNMFFGLYSTIIEYAQRTAKIALPSKGNLCEVLMKK